MGQDPAVQYYKRLYEGIPDLSASATEDEKKEHLNRVNLAHEEAEAELQEFHARRARCPRYTEIENYLILNRHGTHIVSPCFDIFFGHHALEKKVWSFSLVFGLHVYILGARFCDQGSLSQANTINRTGIG